IFADVAPSVSHKTCSEHPNRHCVAHPAHPRPHPHWSTGDHCNAPRPGCRGREALAQGCGELGSPLSTARADTRGARLQARTLPSSPARVERLQTRTLSVHTKRIFRQRPCLQAPPNKDQESAKVASTCSPYFASLFSPTPLTVPSSSNDPGIRVAISRRVASWKMTYAGTPCSLAVAARQARSRSNTGTASSGSSTTGRDLAEAAGLGARRRSRRRWTCCWPRRTAALAAVSTRAP